MLWVAAMIGFVGAGLGLLGTVVPKELWRSLAVIAAVISLVALALFPNAFPALLNKMGAIIIDVAVLATLCVHWPMAEIVGS